MSQTNCECTQGNNNPNVANDPAERNNGDYYGNACITGKKSYWFSSYGSQQYPPPHPFYRSTYMDIGWFPPNEHTIASSFHPSQQRFTNLLSICGMYRNSSLNTALDPQPWGM